MKKKLTPKNLALVVLAVLVLLSVFAYFGRGWIRNDLIPGYFSLAKSAGIRERAVGELENLQNPFELFGYRNAQTKETCELSSARLFSTQVSCSYRVDASHNISQSSISGEQLVQNGAIIQALLQQGGWDGDYSEDASSTSLSDFVGAISKDNDSTPDATYTKNVGQSTCSLQSVAASSAPAPVAMATHFICYETFSLF